VLSLAVAGLTIDDDSPASRHVVGDVTICIGIHISCIEVLFTKPVVMVDSERHVRLRVYAINLLIRYCFDVAHASAVIYLDDAFAVIGPMVIAVVEEFVGLVVGWASVNASLERRQYWRFLCWSRRHCSYFGEKEEDS
jgi:hypothetical protein